MELLKRVSLKSLVSFISTLLAILVATFWFAYKLGSRNISMPVEVKNEQSKTAYPPNVQYNRLDSVSGVNNVLNQGDSNKVIINR